MNFFQTLLAGRQIDSVHVDSEVTYLMLSDGTQVTIRGLVAVEPRRTFLEAAGEAVSAAEGQL